MSDTFCRAHSLWLSEVLREDFYYLAVLLQVGLQRQARLYVEVLVEIPPMSCPWISGHRYCRILKVLLA